MAIQIKGGIIHSDDDLIRSGQKETMPHRLLILSGFTCTSPIWNPLQHFLPQDIQPSLVDWPVHQARRLEDVDELADWLLDAYDIPAYDCLAGHSMGGLVAARALAKCTPTHTRLVLVESFLTTPAPFFRNLLMPETDPALLRLVTEMMDSQRGFYSPVLQEKLRHTDFFPQHPLPPVHVTAIYGDRGCADLERVTALLNWPEELSAAIPVALIPNACHFPMLENPRKTAEVLAHWITSP